jgi:FixJ family two-component response regulator
MGKPESPRVVYIVEDDDDVRGGFSRLVRSAGLEARPYESAERFLEEVVDDERACILLDITMPLLTGIQVQERLNARHIGLPVITISARDDDDTRRLARELGARLFLRKPVDDQALLDAIHWVTTSA